MAPAAASASTINHRTRGKISEARLIRISGRFRIIFQAPVGAGASGWEHDPFHR